MAETAWVLEPIYGLIAEAIAAAIERMLEVDVLVVESEQEVFTAMIAVLRKGAALSLTPSLERSAPEPAVPTQ
jgi:predicted nucleic-acid-binding protein